MENVDAFLNALLDERGIIDIDAETREVVIADMRDRLLDQINRAAIYALPEEKAIELSEKLDDDNFGDEQMVQFMVDSGVDLSTVALATMVQFRNLYINAPKTGEVVSSNQEQAVANN